MSVSPRKNKEKPSTKLPSLESSSMATFNNVGKTFDRHSYIPKANY
jgi:hypothetical protein